MASEARDWSNETSTRWMRRAIDLARLGIGLTSPNPAVGCIVLDSAGALAGEGWHEYDLRDHAEVVALKAAGTRAKGGTAFVTLEPCNHVGRTGPCSQALIAAGIARVIVATTDPNPLVAGQGLASLQAAGVNVEVGVLKAEAQRINEAFARWIVTGLPLVEMKVAMTLDGRIAPAGKQAHRKPYWITGPEARAAVQPLRQAADAVLTGVDTVIADDPLLTDRTGHRRRRSLLRVVLDSGLRMPIESKLVASANNDVLVFAGTPHEGDGHANEQMQMRIRELMQREVRVEVLPSDAGRVPLDGVLEKLGSQGILSVLTETGARLNTALLAAGLVDRLTVYSSPQIMGSDAVPAFRGLRSPVMLEPIELARYGEDLCVSALLRNPWVSAG